MTFTYRHTKYASYLGSITQAIVNNLPSLLFIVFQNEYGISLDKIALLILLNFGVQILTDFAAVTYVNRIGYRTAAMLAHLLCFLGLMGLGILPKLLFNPYLGLVLATIVNAIGGGLIEVLTSPIVEALPGDEKESAMSILHSFYCWGHMGVVLGSTLFFNTIGILNWLYLPILWSILPLMNCILFSKVPIKALVEEGEAITVKKLFRTKIFWLLCLLMICAGASEHAMSQWSSLFAEVGLGVSKNTGDLLGPCLFAVSMGIGRMLYGINGTRLDLRKMLTGSGLCCILCYVTAVYSPVPMIALLGCALCGLSVAIMWPGILSLSAKSNPQGGIGMFAILALAGDVGCSLGPGVVGTVSNATGMLKDGFMVAIIFPVILVIVMLAMSKLHPNDAVMQIKDRADR